MKEIIKYFGFGVLFVSFFTLCTPSQQVIRPREAISFSMKELFDSITVNDGQFKTFSSRFSASYHTPNATHNFKGQIRLVRDSAIWVTITPGLGVELLRIMFTPDSVFFMNRVQNQYYAGDYSIMNKTISVDFSYKALQSILINEFFIYPFNVTDTISFLNEMELQRFHRSVKLQTHRERELRKEMRKPEPDMVYLQYILDLANKKISGIELKELKYSRDLNVAYSEYDTLSPLIVPNKIAIKFISIENTFDFELNYNKKQFDNDLTCPFTIPDKYQPITF